MDQMEREAAILGVRKAIAEARKFGIDAVDGISLVPFEERFVKEISREMLSSASTPKINPGDVVVLRAEASHSTQLVASAIKKATGASLLIVLGSEQHSIESLDEHEMERFGWVRSSRITTT